MGLRYWNEVDENGDSSWVFESRDVSEPSIPRIRGLMNSHQDRLMLLMQSEPDNLWPPNANVQNVLGMLGNATETTSVANGRLHCMLIRSDGWPCSSSPSSNLTSRRSASDLVATC